MKRLIQKIFEMMRHRSERKTVLKRLKRLAALSQGEKGE